MIPTRSLSVMLIFLVLLSWPGVSLLAGTIVVDDDGPSDYSTIKEGVDAASEGDTVLVKAGSYHEWNIVLKEGMVLQGEGADSTFIGGEFEYGRTLILIGGEPLIPYDPPYPFPVVKHAKVEGFTLSSQSNRRDGILIHIGGYGVAPTITRNRLLDSYIGILFQDYNPETGAGTINGNTITGNEFGIRITAQAAWGVWPIHDLDMTLNWWNTTDEAEIAKTLVDPTDVAYPPTTGIVYRPWLTGSVADFAEKEGIHYNSIYGNTYNVSLGPPPISIGEARWGRIKSQMK